MTYNVCIRVTKLVCAKLFRLTSTDEVLSRVVVPWFFVLGLKLLRQSKTHALSHHFGF